jgi:hypothetical protein
LNGFVAAIITVSELEFGKSSSLRTICSLKYLCNFIFAQFDFFVDPGFSHPGWFDVLELKMLHNAIMDWDQIIIANVKVTEFGCEKSLRGPFACCGPATTSDFPRSIPLLIHLSAALIGFGLMYSRLKCCRMLLRFTLQVSSLAP